MRIFQGANPFDQLTRGVKTLVCANVAVFLLRILWPGPLDEFFGLTPILVLKKYYAWQVVTYSFLHGNFWHLFFNMFALWMFGPVIESAWGTRAFIIYYMECVLGAALAQFFLAPYELVIGASGAIYGLLVAFGFLYPDAVIYLFFLFPFRAIQAVFLIAVITFIMALSSGGTKVAHFAHLGGLLTGVLVLKWPVWKNKWRLIGPKPKARLRVIEPTEDDFDNLKNEVDRILEKISAKGVDSLTEDEHKVMQRYAKNRK